jgi:hypothetical protein
MPGRLREQITALLRVHPDGIATLLLFERVGVSTPADRQAVTTSLGRLAAAGQVCRSGSGMRAVWTLAPPNVLPGGQLRGAAERGRRRGLDGAKPSAASDHRTS